MAKERLSKLQKWILMALYLIGPEGGVEVKDLKLTSIHGLKIWGKVEHLESPWGRQGTSNSINVSLCRAFRSLELKDLLCCHRKSKDRLSARAKDMIGAVIPGFGKDLGTMMAFAFGNVDGVILTDEGKDKAKELLNVNLNPA